MERVPVPFLGCKNTTCNLLFRDVRTKRYWPSAKNHLAVVVCGSYHSNAESPERFSTFFGLEHWFYKFQRIERYSVKMKQKIESIAFQLGYMILVFFQNFLDIHKRLGCASGAALAAKLIQKSSGIFTFKEIFFWTITQSPIKGTSMSSTFSFRGVATALAGSCVYVCKSFR